MTEPGTPKPFVARKALRAVLLVGVPLAAAAAALYFYAAGGRNVETDNAYVKSHIITVSAEVAGRVAAVEVRDNGSGIAPDLLPRLFEPFFMTKEMGRGLGLGLAISSSIASDAGGALTARNAPSGGALFVLTLRRACTHHPDFVSEPAGSR